MATLTGTKIKNTYKDLLQVSNSNAGIDATVREVSDGEATASTLQLSTTQVVVDQAGNDTNAFLIRSSDVATGITTAPGGPDVTTEDYFAIGKSSATLGGANVQALGEDNSGLVTVLNFEVLGGQAGVGKSTADVGLVSFDIAEHDGANTKANITADGNIFSVRALVGGSTVTRLLLDEDGDLYVTNTTIQAFSDTLDDAALLRALALESEDKSDMVPSRFDGNRYGRDVLEQRLKLGKVTPAEAAAGIKPMLSHNKLAALTRDAVWQMHEMLDALFDALDPPMRAKVRQNFVDRGLPTAILDWTDPVPRRP